jgi:YgiT-type zinc finger domain-containing protein
MEKCYICEKGNLEKKKVDYKLYGISLGKFDAEVCNKCKETFFSEETSKQMTKIAKKRGLWNLQAKTKIGQAGTTLDIRLPKKIINFLQIKKGEEVKIYPESKDKLIISI